jgi:uncharacterized protein RhaS with RHS repeats
LGLVYNYFRDYDSSLGRYVQFDPIGLRGGVNGFGYVSGNPVLYYDVYGLDRRLESTDSQAGFHQRVSVDTWLWTSPNNAWTKIGQYAQSKGVVENNLYDFYKSTFGGNGDKGAVIYRDTDPTRSVIDSTVTTPQQDVSFLKLLKSEEGTTTTYNLGTGDTCRGYAQSRFSSGG